MNISILNQIMQLQYFFKILIKLKSTLLHFQCHETLQFSWFILSMPIYIYSPTLLFALYSFLHLYYLFLWNTSLLAHTYFRNFF